MAYAVILCGGKQHRVTEGETLSLDKIEQGIGEKVEFKQVLMLRNGEKVTLGTPFVKDAMVEAEVLSQYRGDKIRILKFKRRKHHMKHMGHRQYLTKIRITKIG